MSTTSDPLVHDCYARMSTDGRCGICGRALIPVVTDPLNPLPEPAPRAPSKPGDPCPECGGRTGRHGWGEHRWEECEDCTWHNPLSPEHGKPEDAPAADPFAASEVGLMPLPPKPAAETAVPPIERRIAGIVIPPSEQDWDANDALRQQITALHTQLAAAIAERDAAIEDTKDYLQMAKEKDAAIHRAEQLRADLAQARSALETLRGHARYALPPYTGQRAGTPKLNPSSARLILDIIGDGQSQPSSAQATTQETPQP